jgi:formylglycine-generating enzyme required for sulfatase activity
MTRALATLAFATALSSAHASAQSLFGSGCAGASGATPTLAITGTVKSGSTYTLEVTAPGGLGLGYLLIGFSNTSASTFGGATLPLDLGVLFGDPLWSGCSLNVDPSYAIQAYLFDPNTNGGLASFTLPGFDFGAAYVQAVNLDPDFVTRIAGVSQGLAIRRTPPAGMVAIAPGTFQMGSDVPAGAPYFDGTDSNVAHTVTIGSPFWMGRYEVTQAEYETLMGSNPSLFIGPDRPVERVSWGAALAYCAALTAQETLAGNVPSGYEYRLPTEAEWEFACRAGTTTEFNVGADLFCDQANVSFSLHSNASCGSSGTFDVGSYAPNAWGLHDMHGNVFEWCLDSFANFTSAPATDPFVTGGASRVFRGGGWSFDSRASRSAFRGATALLGSGFSDIGFRVVLAPIPVP